MVVLSPETSAFPLSPRLKAEYTMSADIAVEGSSPRKGLDVSHLRKSFGTVLAVDDLSFSVNRGEILGLIGPNGAGKSTCMMIIIGLLKADAGTIKLDGQVYDPRNPAMRSCLGIVPQELAIYPELTASQNLQFFGSLYGLHGPKLEQRVQYVLELTGLTPNADHTPTTFSGGMSRRLNFGIALLHEPQFVILDEPTVGIDPQSRSNLLDCVRQLSAHGVGVLYASHYMEEVEAICDRVAIIDYGRLLQEGTLDELLDRTQTQVCIKVGTLSSELTNQLARSAKVHADADGSTRIVIQEKTEARNEMRKDRLRTVLDLLESENVPLLGIETNAKSLESLFLQLTGRKLRD
jgi:ABC-2 type transport system ATP-binding protein